jgi:hypothetical protein
MLVVVVDVSVYVVEVFRAVVRYIPRNVINHCEEFGPWVIIAGTTNNLMHVYSPNWVI